MDEVSKEHQKKSIEESEARNKGYDQKYIRQSAIEKLDEQPFGSEIKIIEQTKAFYKTLTETKSGEEKQE
eukprot:7803765-Heterocapsa_arctica.AAC.1